MKNIIYVLCILFTLDMSLIAKDSNDENSVDHLALATLMIYDAKYDKAQAELKLVDKESPNYDSAKYHTVSGVLNSKLKKHNEAIESFKKAIESTKVKEFKAPKKVNTEKYLFSIASKETKVLEPEFDAEKVRRDKVSQLYMYLTQEYYKIKDYANTIKALESAGERGRNRASLYTLRAECYWKLKDYDNAISTLNRGIATFSDDSTLLKQKFYYFADLKLYQAAIDASKVYMLKVGATAKEYIALSQMLIGAKEIDSSIKLLEEAKLRFPKEAKIGILLGHMYLKKDMKHATAHLFEESSYYDKKYIKDAVEMHRRSGNPLHALYLNAQNLDKVEKLKQKIAIYIDSKEFRKVIGLQKALKRYQMLDDDNLRYALAYSFYMSGDYESAEKHLKRITDSELFSKATVIRKNIEKCQNNSLECI